MSNGGVRQDRHADRARCWRWSRPPDSTRRCCVPRHRWRLTAGIRWRARWPPRRDRSRPRGEAWRSIPGAGRVRRRRAAGQPSVLLVLPRLRHSPSPCGDPAATAGEARPELWLTRPGHAAGPLRLRRSGCAPTPQQPGATAQPRPRRAPAVRRPRRVGRADRSDARHHRLAARSIRPCRRWPRSRHCAPPAARC